MEEVLVIGAGVSGLSFASFCARAGRSVRVLEAAETAGGCIQSQRLEDGFWYELGAHTCYNSYRGFLELLEQTPGLGALRARTKVPFRVLVDGEVRSIRKELRLGELMLHAPRLFFAKKQGLTVRDFWSRVVGPRNYAHLFTHAFAAVPSQPADDFPADVFLKTRPGRRKEIFRSFTLEGGLQTAIESMAAQPNVTVERSAKVTGVERDAQGYAVLLADGRRMVARHLALAVPPSEAASLLGPDFPDLAEPLNEIQVREVESVGVAVAAGAVKLEPVAGLIPLDDRFYSAVSRDVLPDAKRRAFAFHFAPGGRREERLDLMAKALGSEPSRFEAVRERTVRLPSPTLGHAERLSAIEKALLPTGLFLTGNYFSGLSIEDCVLRSKAEAQRLLQLR